MIIKTLRLDQTSVGHNENNSSHSLMNQWGIFCFCLFFVVPSPPPRHPQGKIGGKEVLAAQSTNRLLLIDMGTTQSPTIAVALGLF